MLPDRLINSNELSRGVQPFKVLPQLAIASFLRSIFTKPTFWKTTRKHLKIKRLTRLIFRPMVVVYYDWRIIGFAPFSSQRPKPPILIPGIPASGPEAVSLQLKSG
jgi:hypothetical protein